MSASLPPVFEPFLGSLTFTPPSSDARAICKVSEARPSKTADGREFTKPAVAIFQSESTELTITGFRQKLIRLLRESDHVANEPIVDSILACVVAAAVSGSKRFSFLNEILGRFERVDVSHFFVLPNTALTESIRIEGYEVGAISLGVLTSRSNRAGSDYARLYGEMLSGRVCLQSPEFRHVVIDFLKPGHARNLFASEVWREQLLIYFEKVSRQHFDYMWKDLDRTQTLAMPFGANILDADNFRNTLGMFAQRITVYLGFSHNKGGYVVPEGGAVTLNQPGSNSEPFDKFMAHRAKYRINEVGDSELGRTLLACGRLSSEATRFLEGGRPDDAALYATICLEHVFSEKSSAVQAVCTRTAAVTHVRLSMSFSEAEKELTKLYDARSRFVHSGAAVSPLQAERLIVYAREAIRSLLSLHLNVENRTTGFLARWIKDLDWIVAGLRADKVIEPAVLVANGITDE